MLAKAKEKLEEQDDEIKELNELILNAKCHAIRDAQLCEKDEIANAMKEEEVRKRQRQEPLTVHENSGPTGYNDGDRQIESSERI